MKAKFLKTWFFTAVSIFTFSFLQGQSSCPEGHHHHPAPLQFVQNQNQWHPNVLYRAGLGGIDKVFLEADAFTYKFHDGAAVAELHDIIKAAPDVQAQHVVKGHAYRVQFVGANQSPLKGSDVLHQYHNYYLGNDPARWADNVPVFHKITYEEIYDGIQLIAYSQDGLFKYDFVVAPGKAPDQIKLSYEGTDGLHLEDGHLHIKTNVGHIKEFQPYAYQMVDGREKEVACTYVLTGHTVQFYFPKGYDPSLKLVIDPTVVASTLSGTSGSQNFGHTATFDNSGNVFGGGISFGVGYPTTTGAFQNSFAGGSTDFAVTKYTPDGSSQIYATYIGGASGDYPHSMIVDFNGHLCIYGSSNSSDFPTTGNAVQTNFGGGAADIVIAKLNADGTALVGSTYLGGSGGDGRNSTGVIANYGDTYRGEIVLDAQGNIYIASCSNSTNFPTTPNVVQPSNNSSGFNMQEGVVAKFNSDLSTLYWSTYLGSADPDMGFGLRVDDFGYVYVAGAAGSDDFVTTANAYQSDWPGGQANAFVAKLSPDAQQLVASTYFGSTDGSEHAFFIDLDEDGNVHIYGQTSGTIDITPNTYFFNPGSKQFLAAFDGELSSLVYSTVIGSGSGGFGYDFVPVAFMVDKCNGIYLSGYEASSELPVTPDAVASVGTNDFYLAQLTPNAEALNFGTFYPNAYHVDGGTSRFDKGGVIYQAVCSGSSSTLQTTPNAFATNQSVGWDIGVFKIDFEIATVTASAMAAPSTSGCAPFTVDFTYTGLDAETFFWDFGTGVTSTEENPTYTFEEAGTYTVMQVVNAAITCNVTDTFYLQIDVLDNTSTLTDTTFCAGNTDLFLDVSTANATYEWQDGSTGATYQVDQIGTYWVDISISGCTRRDSFVVESATPFFLDLGEDQSLCDEPSYTLDPDSPWAETYMWSNGSTDSMITVTTSGEYWVVILDEGGCEVADNIMLTFAETPALDLGPDTTLCEGLSYIVDATTAGATYQWDDGSTDATLEVTTGGSYSVTITVDGCPNEDEIVVDYEPPLPLELGEDQPVCDQTSFAIDATTPGAQVYNWSTGDTGPVATVSSSGNYSVTISDGQGCETVDDVDLIFAATPLVDLGPDTILCEGQSTTLAVSVVGGTDVEWQDGSTGSTYFVDQPGFYWVSADNEGCVGVDSLQVNYAINPGVVFETVDVPCYGDETGVIEPIFATGGSALDFEWSNGATTAELEGIQAGNYQVTITNEFDCVFEVEVTVNQPDLIAYNAESINVTCHGDANGWLVIDATDGGIPPYLYSFGESDFSVDMIYDGLNGGDYELVVLDGNGCTVSEIIPIYEPPPVDLDAGEDKRVVLGDSVQIDGSLSPQANQLYQWTLGDSLHCRGCLQPFASPTYTNYYVIETVDTLTGCILRDTMRIIVEKPKNVFFPNAFSPNEDGVNDYFFPFSDASVRQVNYFRVYDRWGELVHEAINFQPGEELYGWDGRLDGKFMNPAVFVYVAEVEFVDNLVKVYQGDVTLFR